TVIGVRDLYVGMGFPSARTKTVAHRTSTAAENSRLATRQSAPTVPSRAIRALTRSGNGSASGSEGNRSGFQMMSISTVLADRSEVGAHRAMLSVAGTNPFSGRAGRVGVRRGPSSGVDVPSQAPRRYPPCEALSSVHMFPWEGLEWS